MFSDNEPSCLSAHLSFSVINVKEDSFLMVHITHVPGKFLPRNNLHLLSSVCLCGLFHSGVIYCSTISLALISHSSDWDVIFFLHMSGPWKLKVFLAQRVTFPALPFASFSFICVCVCVFTSSVFGKPALVFYIHIRFSALYYTVNLKCTRYKYTKSKRLLNTNNCSDSLDGFWMKMFI